MGPRRFPQRDRVSCGGHVAWTGPSCSGSNILSCALVHVFSLATYREVGFLAQQLRSLWLERLGCHQALALTKVGDTAEKMWGRETSVELESEGQTLTLTYKVKSTFPVLTSHLLQCVSIVLKEVCLGRVLKVLRPH